MSISFVNWQPVNWQPVRWQPWQEVETVRRQLDQLFEEMTPITREALHQTRLNSICLNQMRTSPDRRVPLIELAATENDLILKVELPGVDRKDLDIQVTPEAVVIQSRVAEHISVSTSDSTTPAIAGNDVTNAEATELEQLPSAQPQIYRSEFRSASFYRAIPLPVEVDNDQVQANLENGVLTLTLPKRIHDRNRAVKVSL